MIPIYRLNIYADNKAILNDLDLASDISDLIEEMLYIGVRPVLDFEGIAKIEPYFIVLMLVKWVLKAKEDTNKIIGICNVSDDQLKLINVISSKILKNGKNILNGIIIPKLQTDTNDLI
jgi:hypothetical protein